MSRTAILVLVAAYLCCVVSAIPTWEGIAQRSGFDVTSFIPGATTVEARGSHYRRKPENDPKTNGQRDYLHVDTSTGTGKSNLQYLYQLELILIYIRNLQRDLL